MKYIISIVIAIIIIAGGYFLITKWTNTSDQPLITPTETSEQTTTQTSTEEPVVTVPTEVETIGTSVNGNPLVAYHYGTGETEVLIVSDIHGGYEWNTALLGTQLKDWIAQNPSVIPSNLSVTIIPTLNPDGLKTTTGTTTGTFSASDVAANTVPGRYNGNSVDINRNFACDWNSSAVWQDTAVNPGTKAFSEPESQALRDYVTTHKPALAVVYYSSAGGVYTSSCGGSVLPETTKLMNTYANASGYPAKGLFTAYAISGDAVNWMAQQSIPAISILLTDHTNAELEKNKTGIEAIFAAYAQQ